jgi:hypothetical protein
MKEGEKSMIQIHQFQAPFEYPGADGTASAAGSASSAGATTSAPPVYLTPDAVMAYCQSRLQGIDSQVQSAMTEQQNVNNEQQGVQQALTDVANLQAEVGDSGVITDKVAAQKLEQDLETLISSIERNDPQCSQLGQLKQLHDTIMASGTGPYTTTESNGSSVQHGYYNGATTGAGMPPNGTSAPSGSRVDTDNTFGSDELKGFSDTLTGINNSLNNSAELGMISIQSLMSQRSTAIQLATNIMQSLDDGTSKIADNIGH